MQSDVVIPQAYRQMLSATARGQKVRSGQYVGAQCIVPFPGPSSMRTVFSYPDIRPAKILVHAVQVDATFIDHTFAYVSWPMGHPLQTSIGSVVLFT